MHSSAVLKLFDSNFDYLLAVDGGDKIAYVSDEFCHEFGLSRSSIIGKNLIDIVAEEALKNIRASMNSAKEGRKSWAVFLMRDKDHKPVYFHSGFAESKDGPLYLFFCNRGDSGDYPEEWEKQKRVHELNCVYAVSDWIEKSSSVAEFFEHLPKYLIQGMSYPDRVEVFSVYQKTEYGDRPGTENAISVKIVVKGVERGEIKVFYTDPGLKFLPEEQMMLNEIGRVLNIALDRKDLREAMTTMNAETEESAKKLEELQKAVAARTAELDAQKARLNTVDSYLDKVNRGWEEAKVQLETMFKAIPDKVAIIDRNRKVILTNRENFPAGEKCHKTFFDRDIPCQDCRLARIIHEKTPITIEIKNDDSYLQVHALPIFNEEQEVEGIIEFYRDISREKTYEEQLRQADKLASIGQLVSGIGHEINNPNQFIRGNVKILQQALEDMLPIIDEYAKSHPDLKIAKLKYDFFRQHIMTLVNDMAHGSERIKGIVEGLKRFAKRDEGLLIDNVDVNTIIAAAARLVHNQVHKTSDIELNLASEIPALTGNAQKIEQIVVNLVMNASEAIPEGRRGKIMVSTRMESGNLVLEVKDNGKGMNEATMKKIFEPFFTTRRAKGGTGLGLAIVYRIIEEHGGNVSLKSTVDVGTTFTVTFPIRRRSSKQPAVN
jgi:PAS domain S-box-containing protein